VRHSGHYFGEWEIGVAEATRKALDRNVHCPYFSQIPTNCYNSDCNPIAKVFPTKRSFMMENLHIILILTSQLPFYNFRLPTLEADIIAGWAMIEAQSLAPFSHYVE